MDIRTIQEYLHPQMLRVGAIMDQALRSDIALLDSTNALLRSRPGKMIRPSLALLVANACGTPTEDSYRYAAAAELLHNATLLHDDVVDGAQERRGQPTVAKLLNGRAAVLMGDYWLVKCLDLIMDTGHSAEVLRIFSRTLSHLTEGELLQMEKAGKGDTLQAHYERIILGKTASLFEASTLSAALSVDAPQETVEAMGRMGRALGMAFQIKDDIMDYSAARQALGKPVGIDLLEQKITQPLLCALDGVSPEQAADIRSKVARIAKEPALAARVRDFVLAQDGVAKAALVMDSFIGQALRCLESLPESAEKSYLKDLANFIAEREV